MRYWIRAIGSLLLTAMLTLSAFTQSIPGNAQNQNSSSDASYRPQKGVNKKRSIKSAQHIDRALMILEHLSDTAEAIEDEKMKVKVQARIAGMLWPYNESQARNQLIGLFHAIDSIKSPANPQTPAPDVTDTTLLSPQFNLRQEVLQIIAEYDFHLAESLRKSLNRSAKEEVSGSKLETARYEQSMHSMLIAASLASTNPERAAQIVREGFRKGINEILVSVLIQMRHKNPGLADTLFNEALSIARAIPGPISGHLRALTLYALPNEEESFLNPNPSLNLRQRAVIEQFLNFTCDLVTMQLNATQQITSDSNGPEAITTAQQEYVTLQNILPLFTNYMPEKRSIVQARMIQLASYFPSQQLTAIENASRQNSLDELKRRAERSPSSRQRDILYIQAAMLAWRQNDPDDAISIAQRISNKQDSLSIISIIRFQAALMALNKEDIDGAYIHARDITIPNQRVAVFGRIARTLMGKQDVTRGSEILWEIEKWVSKSDKGPEKAQALLSIVNDFASYDPMLAFEVMNSAIKAINEADFDPQNVTTSGEKGLIESTPITIESLDFKSTLPLLVRSDFERALLLAQSLNDKEASVLAQLAICHEVLTNSRANQIDKSNKKKGNLSKPGKKRESVEKKNSK